MELLFLGLLVVGLVALRGSARIKEQALAIEALTTRIAALERDAALVGTKSAPLGSGPARMGSDPASSVEPATHFTPAAPTAPLPAATKPVPLVPLGSDPALGVEPDTHRRPPAPSILTSTPTATPTPVTSATAAMSTRDSLETRIGARWLLYVGVIAIVVGVSYFEKLAIENHWINETARTIQGAVIGMLLVYAGTRFVRAGYRIYGQMIAGGGVAVLYVVTYAAFNLYHLIGRPVAFVLMTVITALAASLADRQRSQGLALMAVGGGFATPFLLPGESDAEIGLFTYDAILIGGTMFLAHRRLWPLLNVVSYAFTVLTVLGWAAEFYTPAKYLPTELFLTLFCGMYLYLLHETLRSSELRARVAQAILWTGPAFYYIASIAILAPHSAALLVYLLGLSLVGAAIAMRTNATIRLVFWIAVFVPLTLWSDVHAGRTWLLGGLAAIVGIYTIHLLADLERVLRADEDTEPAAIVLFHLNALAAYGCAYLLIDAVNSAATAPAAAGFALWHGVLAIAIANRRRGFAMHAAAVASSLVAIAIALQFHGTAAVAGWGMEGAAVAWLGLRERREWFRAGGIALFAFAISQLLALQLLPPSVDYTVLFNSTAASGLFLVALTYGLAWSHDRHPELPGREFQVGIALTAAKLLILSVAATEIVDYWRLHGGGIFEPWANLVFAALVVGAVIVWLGLVRKQEWIRGIGGLVVSAALLLLLSLQFQTAPTSYRIVLNARAAAGVLAIAALYGLAALHTRWGKHVAGLASHVAVLITVASLFTLSLLTSEIDAYWGARGAADVWSVAREGLQAIVWAAIGSSLVWVGLNRRRGWIRSIGAAVLAVSVSRLLWLQLAAAPAGYVVIVNARLIASVFVIAALYGIARLYQLQHESLDGALRPRTVLLFAANVLSLTLLTSEITAYWHVRDLTHEVSTTIAADSHFARELMLSITWAIYATALIVAGIRKRYAPIRYFAIALFAVTIVKVFGIDMAELDRIYRVASVIVLGVMLLATSFLYNRFRSQLEGASES